MVWTCDWASANQTPASSGTEYCEKDDQEVQQNSNSSFLDTVRFKGLGATHDKKHQEALEAAHKVLCSGQNVCASLRKEPYQFNQSS